MEYGGFGGNGKKRRGVFRFTTKIVFFRDKQGIWGGFDGMRQKQDVSEDRADGKEGRKQAAKRLPVRAVSYPPLARSHSIPVFPPVLDDRFEVFPPPFFQPYQMGNQGRSEFGHAIFRFGRNGGIYFPRDQAVRDQ